MKVEKLPSGFRTKEEYATYMRSYRKKQKQKAKSLQKLLKDCYNPQSNLVEISREQLEKLGFEVV